MKTFSFGPDSEKVLEELLDLYLNATALCEVLRGILDEAGIPRPDVPRRLASWDSRVVDAIRHPPTQNNPLN